jgi:hypothetical protein
MSEAQLSAYCPQISQDLPTLLGSPTASGRPEVLNLLIVAGVGLGVWVVSCLVMMLLAHRLPPGLLRQVAEFLPACVTTARVLRKDPAVPRRAKVALLVAIVWVISPIDLLPEFLPVIGPLDDVVAVILLLLGPRPAGAREL